MDWMHRVRLFFSVEELPFDYLKGLDGLQLLDLERRLKRKRTFFFTVFAIAVFFCVLTALSHARKTGI